MRFDIFCNSFWNSISLICQKLIKNIWLLWNSTVNQCTPLYTIFWALIAQSSHLILHKKHLRNYTDRFWYIFDHMNYSLAPIEKPFSRTNSLDQPRYRSPFFSLAQKWRFMENLCCRYFFLIFTTVTHILYFPLYFQVDIKIL